MIFFPLAAVMGGDDRSLVRRLKQREERAVAELYDRYGRVVYSLICRIVRNPGTAEDLTQETFLRIWNRAHVLDETQDSLGPWVLTVARHRAIDYMRSLEQRVAGKATSLEGSDHPAALRSAEGEVIRAEQAERLRAAFHRLPERQRQVIELAYFEGLSQTEMAERLQQPLGTVKTWVRSALRTLRQEMGETVPV